jgi:dTDP-4-amino-4,6-dideoxygalactose transaminase
MHPFEAFLAEQMQRRYARIVGRGTTALYVALRALAMCQRTDALCEIILPDIICSVVLDAVLLAGFVPIFADISPDRFALDWTSVRTKVTANTRVVIGAHVFGYANNIESLGIPVIEDAVQGLGGAINGKPIGTLGDISFASFHPTKMISGQGGVVATDDPNLCDAIHNVELDLPFSLSPYASKRYQNYAHQLAATRAMLIRPFDGLSENESQIREGWKQLATNVVERNAKAAYLRERLAKLPLILPTINSGDAIWRYTFAAPTVPIARWIMRHLQLAGLTGSNLYPSLSSIFAPDEALQSNKLAPRLINLWVDEATTYDDLDRMIQVISRAPM